MRKRMILFFGLLAAGAVSAAQPDVFEALRPQALSVLRNELAHASEWVKVHAAEELLQLGYVEGVEETFLKELERHGEQPEYRVGILRVLARTALTRVGKQQRTAEIKAIFLDEAAPDRGHALETLGKLEVALSPAELAAVRNDAEETQSSFAYWVLAQHGEATAGKKLREQARSEDPLQALRAAFCLAQLEPQTRDEWLADDGAGRASVLLTHSNVWERTEGCRQWGRYGMRGDYERLLPLLGDPEADVRVYAAAALLRMERNRVFRLGWPDFSVVAVYFLSLIGIGWYYARKTQTTDDYLLGGRNMKSWMVGLSLFAALLSTASYMSVPGEIVKHGPMIMAQLTAIPLIMWVVGWFLIPVFMKLPITSANELLELRLGLSVRMLGSAFFLFARIAWMAMIIYITVKAVLMPITGLPAAWFPWVCVLLGVITMAYTSSGGLKAAVLADVIQSFILYFGAILSILIVSFRLKGFGWFPTEWAPTWDPPVFWFDPKARITFAGAGMMMFFWYVCTAGSDQMAVQRYLATRDAKAARSAFNFNLMAVTLVILFLGLLGFAMYGYFESLPHELAGGMNIRRDADGIFPHFIVSGLPVGISGLITAALLAAALSSLSGGLNSTCSVITVDFMDRFSKKKLDEKHHVRRARLVSLSIGVAVIFLSLLVGRVEGNFTEMVNKIGNLLVAPLFVLFFMALFVPWSNAAGTWIGAACAVAAAVGIAFFRMLGLSFIWIMPVSVVSGIASGVVVSLLFGGRRKTAE